MKDCLERIRLLRQLKGYSQNYMALKLGISQRAYSKLETNKVELTVKRLKQIANVLEIEAGELIK